MADILTELNITDINKSACTGHEHWLQNEELGTIDSINPANGKVIAKVARSGKKDYEQIVKTAQEAFATWRKVPAPKRGELVRQIGEALRKHKDALGSLVSMEMGKIKAEGDGEVQEMIDMADFAVGQSRMLYGKTMHSERPEHRMYEQWHPLGIIGVISAFNFPIAVWAWNAFIAAICGNTTIWKPSPKTPLTAIAVQHICNQVMQENGYHGIFNLFISDDIALSEHFVSDTRLPLISFTGSTAVGKLVNEKVARRLGRSLLELGGNNAIIVDENANLDLVLRAIVFGAVGTNGQRCTTTRRLFLHEKIHDAFVTKLANAYNQLRIGDPLDTKTLVGPLIDQHAVNLFEKALAEVRKNGGEIVCGGRALSQSGYFVEPTIVTGVQNDWAIVQHETFAPILYVMKYKNLNDAIALQNAVPQGLSSALFTNTLQHAEQFLAASGSDCGIANINIGTSGAEIGGAFGGEKDTGGGREAGSDSWKQYMRRQTNTINWGNTLPLAQGIEFNL
jgi:aldehyde dehydrogenase (NAD+)